MYLKVVKTVDVKSSHKKRVLTMWGNGCVKFIVIIISQYTHMYNHYVVHINLTECYMSIISLKLGGKKRKKS